MNFGSHTDGVVAAGANLVNVATPGERQGRPYLPPEGAELRQAVADAVAIPLPPASRLPAFVELAAAARTVFELVQRGRTDRAAVSTNALMARYGPVPFLDRHDDEPWHLHFHGSPANDPSGWGGGVAVALANVLGSGYAERLGVCEAPVCDRVFVDVSRNGTRRFCSTTCQNRVKTATHRARHA